jgi:hypothetical protein
MAGVILVARLASIDLALAEGCDILSSPATCVAAEEGNINVGRIEKRGDSEPIKSAGSYSNGSAELTAATQAFCADATANAVNSGGAPQAIVDLCGFLGARVVVVPSREEVLRAFEELGLYRGAIRTDPGVATLVNLETYFWCADDGGRGCDVVGEGERTVTLLGQPVRIRPRIVSYAWDFGDGAGQDSDGGRVVHTYAHAGTATVTLTLTWTADYAVGAGGFQPIGGTTTTTSPARALPVREAEAVIVGDN